MQLLMLIIAATLIHITIGYIIIGLTPDLLHGLLKQYPSLVCSLFSLHGYVVAGICLMFILIFKIYLQLRPLLYLEMNHEMVRTLVYIIILVTSILEVCFMLVQSGTLCARQKVLEFKLLNCLVVDIDHFTFAPPMGALNAAMIVVLEFIYVISEFKKWIYHRKSRIQVQPTSQV